MALFLLIPFCDVITLHHVFIFIIYYSKFVLHVLVNVLNHMYLIIINY